MVDAILLTAQISAFIAVVFGVVSLVCVIIAAKHILPGPFKSILSILIIALSIIIVGSAAMFVYHLAEGTAYHEISEIGEGIWYVFMFLGLLLFCIESLKIILFNKSILPITKLQKKKPAK